MPFGNALNNTSAAGTATYSTITLGANTTIAMWLYFTGSTVNYNCLLGNDIWYHGSGANPGKLQFVHSAGGNCLITTSSISNDANWHLYVITDNGSIVKCYRDTVDMGNSVGYKSLNGCQTLKLLQGVNNNAYMGLIDQVSIWSRVLSSAELTGLYNGGAPTYSDMSIAPWSSSLTACWTFDGVLRGADFSRNNHTIIINNASVVTGIVPEFPTPTMRNGVGIQGVIGALKGITLGGPTSYLGDGTFGRHMQTGVTENFDEGNPTAPCLQLTYPGFWRFRWSIKPGLRSIYIQTKQPHFLSGSVPYVNVFYPPTLIVKANSTVGLNTDLIGTAPVEQGWVQIGPVSFTATAVGPVWVELWNNNTNEHNTPCLFDRIIAT